MKSSSRFRKSLAAAFASALLSVPALAAPTEAVPYADELDACVTAMKGSIEMTGVTRIRHVVTRLQPEVIGYRMTLHTSTFTDNLQRNYSASCFANGNNRPFKLRVTEIRI